MAMIVSEERVSGPAIKLLIDELLQLRITRDRVDHPRKGSKDLADAVCGSIFNAISKSKQDKQKEIQIHTYDSMNDDNDQRDEEVVLNMIRAPRIPTDLQEAMENMQII